MRPIEKFKLLRSDLRIALLLCVPLIAASIFAIGLSLGVSGAARQVVAPLAVTEIDELQINSFVRFGGSGPTLTTGSGVPSASAARGSLYLRTATAQLYQNTDGATTWALISATVSGTSGKSARFTGTATIGDGAWTDDGTNAETTGRVTIRDLLIGPEVTVTAPASGLVEDWDPVSTATTIRVDIPDAGTILGGMCGTRGCGLQPRDGEIRIIRNIGGTTDTATGKLVLAQNSTGSSYKFHLGGRRPWLVVSLLETVMVQWDTTQGMWFVLGLTDVDSAAYPRSITPAAAATGNLNNYDPTDATYGTNYRYANWVRFTGSVGTNLTGIASGVPFAGNSHGVRFAMTNYGTTITIAHNSGLSSVGNRIYTPNQTTYYWQTMETIWFIRDELNQIWVLEGDQLFVGAPFTTANGYLQSDGTIMVTAGVTAGRIPRVVSGVTFGTASLGDDGTNATANGKIIAAGADPALSSCGSSPTFTAGSDVAGHFTVGSGGVTACTLTFNSTYTAEPSCTISSNFATAGLYFSAKSATAFTIAAIGAADFSGAEIDYHCWKM